MLVVGRAGESGRLVEIVFEIQATRFRLALPFPARDLLQFLVRGFGRRRLSRSLLVFLPDFVVHVESPSQNIGFGGREVQTEGDGGPAGAPERAQGAFGR